MHNLLLQVIGNTPLVKVFHDIPTTLYAKLEYLNPGGSIKDRSAAYMIEHAEKHGQLKSGMTIIDASSGNHGIAVAMIGAVKGYKVIICASEKSSKEKINTIKAYGAEVRTFAPTEYLQHPESYHSQAVRLHQQMVDSFMPNQYFNVVNRDGHYHSLGPEIWSQTKGKVTHFFAGAGTGGTISGAGAYLKEKNPAIKIIAIDSNNSYRATNGNPKPYQLEGMGIDFDSPVLDKSIIDHYLEVSDEQGISMLRQLAKNQGLLVGPSSGAVAYAAQAYSKNMKPSDLGVLIFGDSGRAYLSKNWY
ncbi:cysteine synthase family protein [Candidatus Dependentiae bacterium]|nr:cysteine synthase family protein [Candidatus Dependentiae bacterium]